MLRNEMLKLFMIFEFNMKGDHTFRFSWDSTVVVFVKLFDVIRFGPSTDEQKKNYKFLSTYT